MNVFPQTVRISPPIKTGDEGLLTFQKSNAYAIIIDTFRVSMADNFQIKRSFDEDVYITTFGQQLSKIDFSGVYIDAFCKKGAVTKPDIKKFYAENRIAKGTTMKLTVAKINYIGVLISLNLEIVSKENMQALGFSCVMLGVANNL